MKSIINKIASNWKATSVSYTWKMAFRKANAGDIIENNLGKFIKIRLSKPFTWGADPFLVERNGKMYLFFEAYDRIRKKGYIACKEYKNGRFQREKTIIIEPYHLSFPCVFLYNDEIFIIPETSAIGKLILYKCDEFPYQWHKEKVLLEGVNAADTVYFEKNEHRYLLSSILEKGSACKANNVLYEIIDDQFSLKRVTETGSFDSMGIRNAGALFEREGKLFRPGQDCTRLYGGAIVFWKMSLDNDEISETLYNKISPQQILDTDAIGCHTYNWCNGLEIVDLLYKKKNSVFERILFIAIRCFLRLFDER